VVGVAVADDAAEIVVGVDEAAGWPAAGAMATGGVYRLGGGAVQVVVALVVVVTDGAGAAVVVAGCDVTGTGAAGGGGGGVVTVGAVVECVPPACSSE
jgi:hypothetical protein